MTRANPGTAHIHDQAAREGDVTPLIIVDDLGPARWVELPEAVVAIREWLSREFGPKRSPCLCDGSGTYPSEIPLADAVLLTDRRCPAGCQPPEPQEPQQAPDSPQGGPA